ncbi:MAG: APC family permease [Acidimicrobiia bacterium]
MAILKRLLVGRPLSSAEQEHQRIPKVIGLAVFSSDAISSTAYATEEILFVTALGASSLALGLDVLVPIAIAVAVLLAIVVTSYRRTIYAYPGGGGSYVVSRENLGTNVSLVAGASILVDYILTVAVSISAGVAAIVSIPAFEGLRDQRVLLCIGAIALITITNLRGIKESGRIFALPTYLYIVTLAGLVLYGLGRSFFPDVFGSVGQVPFDAEQFEGVREAGGTLGLFLLLKGFSSGAVALTGIEAIADGVPAFRRPESRNASRTLIWMAIILGSLFFGTATLAHRLHPYPSEDQTVLAQLGQVVFGDGPVFVLLQVATAVILVLAANTAYADFPRLSSIIARDGFLPRQLANRGDRLVFSNGIVFLAVAAAGLIVAFGGITNALIPLYAVGVFTSFTLSQLGMVRYQRRERTPGWKVGVAVSGLGAAVTFAVLLIVAVTKFTSGAWIPLIVIPAIVVLFKAIGRHYATVREGLRVPADFRPRRMNHTVVVLVGSVHRGVLEALAYARSLAPNHLLAVTVVSDEEEQEHIESVWNERNIDVPLEIVYDPYRELTRPILRYIDEIEGRWDNDIITVLIPEFVVKHWWSHLLHNQSALILKGRLLFRKGTVVTSVPYHLE